MIYDRTRYDENRSDTMTTDRGHKKALRLRNKKGDEGKGMPIEARHDSLRDHGDVALGSGFVKRGLSGVARAELAVTCTRRTRDQRLNGVPTKWSKISVNLSQVFASQRGNIPCLEDTNLSPNSNRVPGLLGRANQVVGVAVDTNKPSDEGRVGLRGVCRRQRAWRAGTRDVGRCPSTSRCGGGQRNGVGGLSGGGGLSGCVDSGMKGSGNEKRR